jgi:hypothetical protein
MNNISLIDTLSEKGCMEYLDCTDKQLTSFELPDLYTRWRRFMSSEIATETRWVLGEKWNISYR